LSLTIQIAQVLAVGQPGLFEQARDAPLPTVFDSTSLSQRRCRNFR
jgi:hypothetical protein